MQVPDTIQTVLMAGGFFITLGWLQSEEEFREEANWKILGTF